MHPTASKTKPANKMRTATTDVPDPRRSTFTRSSDSSPSFSFRLVERLKTAHEFGRASRRRTCPRPACHINWRQKLNNYLNIRWIDKSSRPRGLFGFASHPGPYGRQHFLPVRQFPSRPSCSKIRQMRPVERKMPKAPRKSNPARQPEFGDANSNVRTLHS